MSLLAFSAKANGASWEFVGEGSRLGFTATWENVPFNTQFETFEVQALLNDGAWSESELSVEIDIASVNSGNRDRDDGMVTSDWFDGAAYPVAMFQAGRFAFKAPDRIEITGELAIKGVTQTIVALMRWEAKDGEARLSGEVPLVRGDFNVGDGEWRDATEIGQAVKVNVDFRFVAKP